MPGEKPSEYPRKDPHSTGEMNYENWYSYKTRYTRLGLAEAQRVAKGTMHQSVEIAYFRCGEFSENILKSTPIWELKLTNFSLGYGIYESY